MNAGRQTMPEPVPLLLVDDRHDNLLVLEQILDSDDYRLSFAESGQEALRAALKNDFALVLMDVQMPEMDGFETAELMRANPNTRHQPIIFVTAGLRAATYEFKGYETGAVDYLMKPIEPFVLRGKVRIFADLYRQRRRIEQQERHLQSLVDQRTAELQRSSEKLAASLHEKEILLKEIYHRVKNNLQIVSSLLAMQARDAGDGAAADRLRESADRVRSIAMVHEQLYKSHNLARIDYDGYLTKLVDHLAETHQPLAARVPIRLDVDALQLGVETAVPLGLIVTELISNAYKHAFADAVGGEIRVVLRTLDDGRVRLSISDTGRGLPPDYDIERAGSLGMRLVRSLTDQLDGQLTIRSEGGACFVIVFLPTPATGPAAVADDRLRP